MEDTKIDNRYKERLVVLVTSLEKERIAAATAVSARDEMKISNLVRRAIDELIERENLIPETTSDERGAA